MVAWLLLLLLAICNAAQDGRFAKCPLPETLTEHGDCMRVAQWCGFKWAGYGCKLQHDNDDDDSIMRDMKLPFDGGCRYFWFCGYHCSSACQQDQNCQWQANRCYPK